MIDEFNNNIAEQASVTSFPPQIM